MRAGQAGQRSPAAPLLLEGARGRPTPGPTVAADLGGSGSVSGAGGASRAAQRRGGAAAPAAKGKVLPGSWTRRGAAGRLAQPCETGGEGEREKGLGGQKPAPQSPPGARSSWPHVTEGVGRSGSWGDAQRTLGL